MRGSRPDRSGAVRIVPGVLLVAMVLAVPSAVTAAGRSTQNSSLSFARTGQRGYCGSVFLASFDGRGVSRVLRGRGSTCYSNPAWSNDGRRLAVTVADIPAEGNEYDYVAVIRNGKPLDLAGGESDVAGRPSWASDGRRLVLVGYQTHNGGGLYIDTVGLKNGQKQLTAESIAGGPVDDMPAWSPDGSTIAFVRRQHGRTRLYLIQPNGRGERRLTTVPGWNPSWSPDSKRVVFDDGHRIAVVDRSGKHLRYLTPPHGYDSDPAWSPGGRTIAFVRDGDIWLMNKTGGGEKLLISDADEPAWKPGTGEG